MCASSAIHKVYSSAKTVLANWEIGSLVTYIEIFQGEALIIKEEGGTKDNDAGVQSGLWYKWVMDVYHMTE